MHFEERQAQRDTWIGRINNDPIFSRNSCVFFILGGLDNTKRSEEENNLIRNALKVEQGVYGDLLLGEEIPVVDSYYSLVEKSCSFMRYAVENFNFGYLMMADDDVFLDFEKVLYSLQARDAPINFYAGEVWEDEVGHPVKPNRDKSHRNSISFEEFPGEVFPPFAVGPHYILSRDLVNWIAENSEKELKAVGSLEDVSVGVWLDGLGMKPEHINRFASCTNGGSNLFDIVSLSDLRPHGIRSVFGNFVMRGQDEGRSLTEGFESHWCRSRGSFDEFKLQKQAILDAAGAVKLEG